MANSAQARKRARQAVKARALNMSLRSRLRTAIKAVRKAVVGGDKQVAQQVFVGGITAQHDGLMEFFGQALRIVRIVLNDFDISLTFQGLRQTAPDIATPCNHDVAVGALEGAVARVVVAVLAAPFLHGPRIGVAHEFQGFGVRNQSVDHVDVPGLVEPQPRLRRLHQAA